MSLFDIYQRIETRAKRQNEAQFDYLNSSARPYISAIRQLLDLWYQNFPLKARSDLRGRFRSRDKVQNSGAFFELCWHELLLRSGYEVEVHPKLAGMTTSPDFLALQNGTPQFYLEATIAMPPGDLAADKRFAELHDTLNRMNTTNFFLSVEYSGSLSGDIKGRDLRKRLEAWLNSLDHEEVVRAYREGDYSAVPSFTLNEQGLFLTISPIPKSPQARERSNSRAVGIVAPDGAYLVRTHEDIRTAIDAKASKYGKLDLPFVIAVNVMAEFCGDYDKWNALFGEEYLELTLRQQGQLHTREARSPNGAWRGHRGPRNILVSAVTITNQLSPQTLRSETVELIHNPWAANPLPQDALPLPQKTISPTDGRIHKGGGRSAADILEIPEPWPIPD